MGGHRTKILELARDRISEMPDEILAFTLFLLPIREATKTSILSSRWRYLWKASVALSSAINLDIQEMRGSDYPENFFVIFKNGLYREKSLLLSSERLKFMDWVNMILKLTSANVLDSFRIRYYLGRKEFDHLIDEWLSVAISKKVNHYDINLAHFDSWVDLNRPGENLYKLPNWLFTQETVLLLKSLSLHSCVFKPLVSNCYTSLLELQLDHVLLHEDNFVNILSKCPNLEKLYLSRCWKVFKLDIRGSLHKLKHLALVHCDDLISVVIDAKNLMRFDSEGCKAKICFQNFPKLSIVTIDYHMISNLSATLQDFSSHLPKLASLTLTPLHIPGYILPTQLVNLTKLELMIMTFQDRQALWSYIPLIQSAPNLLKLEMNWILNISQVSDSFVKPKPFGPPHHCLEEIKLTGFTGTDHEIEFVMYMITNTNALKMITVSRDLIWFTNDEGYVNRGFCGNTAEPDRNMIIKVNQQLMNVIPSGAQLQFI